MTITFNEAQLERCRGELWQAFFDAIHSERHKTVTSYRADAFAHVCFRNSAYGSLFNGGGQAEWIHQPSKGLLWYLKQKTGIKPKFYEALNGEREWFLQQLLDSEGYRVMAEEIVVESICDNRLRFWRADGTQWPICDATTETKAQIRLIVSPYLFVKCMESFSRDFERSVKP